MSHPAPPPQIFDRGLINLRLDPFERTGWPDSGTKYGAQEYFDWFKYEFWRFVFVQQQVEKLAMTAIEFISGSRTAKSCSSDA